MISLEQSVGRIEGFTTEASRVRPPLKLLQRECLFTKMVTKEKVSKKKLKKLLKQRAWIGGEWFLQHYINNIKDGEIYIPYEKKINGRINPHHGISLGTMKREIRHTLVHKKYTDVDIVNCHPVILLCICLVYGIPCKHLEKYVMNRDAYLNRVMKTYGVERHVAKNLFIRLMYLGGFNAWSMDNGIDKTILPELSDYQVELKNIARHITDNNPDIVDFVRKNKTENGEINYYLESSVLATYLQEWECRLLETIVKYCMENDIIRDNTFTPCHDGLLLERAYFDESYLKIFEDLIRNEYDFDVKFEVKEMKNIISTKCSATGLSQACYAELFEPRQSRTTDEALVPCPVLRIMRLLNSTIEFEENREGKYRKVRKQLTNILNRGTIKIGCNEYSQVDYCRNLVGRSQPMCAEYQNLSKKVRNFLLHDYLSDIDAVNSITTIIYNLVCKFEDVAGSIEKYPILSQYYHNREAMIKEVMTKCDVSREQVKDRFISMLNGGAVPPWRNVPDCMRKLQDNMRCIIHAFANCNKNLRKIIKRSNKNASPNELDRKVFSQIVFEWEDRISEIVYLYLKDNNYLTNGVRVHAYDGIMIPSETYHPGLLDKLSKEVHDKIGFTVKFLHKPMTERYTDDYVMKTQANELADEELLTTRPEIKNTNVLSNKDTVSLINNLSIFKDCMQARTKNGNYYNMTCIGSHTFKCPVTEDCVHDDPNPGSVCVTRHGIKYYCHGEKCKKKEGEKYASYYMCHIFNKYTECGEDLVDDAPPVTTTEERLERIKNSTFYDQLTNASLEDGNYVGDNGRCYYSDGVCRIPLTDLSTEGNTMFVKSPMGSGKTEVIQHLLRDLKEKNSGRPFRVLSLTNRRALTHEQEPKLSTPADKFTKYFDVKGELTGPYMIIQLEAIHRYVALSGVSLLILDECIGLFEQIKSNQFSMACWIKFKNILQKATYVVCLDANINTRFVELIKSTREGKKSLFYQNCNEQDRDTTIYYTTNNRIMIGRIKQSLMKGKRIVITTNSKKEGDALEEMIIFNGLSTRNKVINYSSDTPDDVKKEHFMDVNHHWSQYNVLIYTPAINNGVSFTLKHFDELFAVFSSDSCTVESSLQMIKRVRDISSKRIHVCFIRVYTDERPVSEDEIRQYLYRTISSYQREYDPNTILRWKPHDDLKTVRKIKENAYYKIIVYLITQENESKNNFMKRFFALAIENQGWRADRIKPMNEDYCKQYGLNEEALKSDYNELIMASKFAVIKKHMEIVDSDELTHSEASLIESKKKNHIPITQKEQNEITRYKFVNHYVMNTMENPVTYDFYANYESSNVRRVYYNQCFVFRNGIDNIVILQKLFDHEKKAVGYDGQAHSVINDDVTFRTLTKKYNFDRYRYSLGILHGLGFSHLWQSIDFGELYIITKKDLHKTLSTLFNEFANEKHDNEPVNIRHNMLYLKQLFDINGTYLLNMDMGKIVFDKILKITNKILNYVFGVVFESYEKSGYVLRHTNRFRNSKFSVVEENDDKSIPIEAWPCLDMEYIHHIKSIGQPVIKNQPIIPKEELFEATNKEIKAMVTTHVKMSALIENFDEFYKKYQENPAFFSTNLKKIAGANTGKGRVYKLMKNYVKEKLSVKFNENKKLLIDKEDDVFKNWKKGKVLLNKEKNVKNDERNKRKREELVEENVSVTKKRYTKEIKGVYYEQQSITEFIM
jgi:hypothetical protein